MDLISKYDLIERIVKSNDEALLQQVKNLLEEEEAESWEDMDPSLKASIKKGVAQAEKGQGIPHKKIKGSLQKKYIKK